MIPAWKIRREALRFFTQIREMGQLANGYLARRRYDRVERSGVVITPADRPAGADMAILLIFQPDGLLASLFFELVHLRTKGLEVVLVANHPLDDADMARLKPFCHLIIERPNIGYDFGGYREGILTLFERGIRPENLFVMNDSVWFPLKKDCTLIETAMRSDADAFGIFQNTKSRRSKHHHLQSYFFRFKGSLINDRRFLRLWKNMPFFDSKRLVIRRLEVKFSGRIAGWGYQVASLATPEDVAAAGAKLGDQEWAEVAYFYATTSLRGRDICGTLVDMQPTDAGWKAECEKILSDSRFRYFYIDGHPLLLFGYLNTPFLKKSREYRYYKQRDTLLEQGYHMAFDPIVQREVIGWNAAGEAQPPESTELLALAARLDNSPARSSGKSS